MAVFSFRQNAALAATVRHSLKDSLSGQGATQEAIEDLLLIASELFSNSLSHARPLPGGTVEVEWSVQDEVARISVTDGGAEHGPTLTQAGDADVHGRGLSIVAALSEQWGVTSTPASTTVWATHHL